MPLPIEPSYWSGCFIFWHFGVASNPLLVCQISTEKSTYWLFSVLCIWCVSSENNYVTGGKCQGSRVSSPCTYYMLLDLWCENCNTTFFWQNHLKDHAWFHRGGWCQWKNFWDLKSFEKQTMHWDLIWSHYIHPTWEDASIWCRVDATLFPHYSLAVCMFIHRKIQDMESLLWDIVSKTRVAHCWFPTAASSKTFA